MRFRKVLFVASLLVAWTFLTLYILLRNNSEFSLKGFTIQHRLHQLDVDTRAEYRKNQRLTQTLLEILKFKYVETTTGVAIVPPKQPPIDIVALHNGDDELLGLQQPPEPQSTLAPTVTTTANEIPTITHLANGQPVIPILVFACNRISVSKCLDNLVNHRPSVEQFPIIVSQDCGDEATRNVILSYKNQVHLIEQPDQTDIFVPSKERKFKGYYKIARHYGWALNTTFSHGFEFVVIVEDDLNVAPDFFEYFLGTHHLLKEDPTLWCVSAWNDNGKANFVDDSHPELLYRTDFFPGLGWMLTRELWHELSVKWPKSFWDDWIRHPEQRKNRVCIRPEVSRTRTFGKIGVSNGLFFDKYLKHIKLSENFVEFTKMNLNYLLKENYDNTFLKDVYTYPIVTYDELRRNLIKQDGPVRITYTTKDQYKRMTKMLGLMDDFKSGVPRTAYHGVVSFFYNKRRVHLAPNANWKGYDLSWS